jgi:UDP-glucuronate 4-epimerase
MKVLVTGNAGFIGFHVAKALLERGDEVVGLDVVNDYYDPDLKEARLRILDEADKEASYSFIRGDLAQRDVVDACFDSHRFDRVIHLAAQAGVRYSIHNPRAYIESNIVAFTNLLEACRDSKVPHLTYASSSSVYGGNTKLPFSEHDGVDHPLSVYAATKRSNELLAHAYSHLFQLPTTGLRFFTVYGPWGRPDMALSVFTRHIVEGMPIDVFNGGNHSRDFTYIDDVVDGVIRASDRLAEPNPHWSNGLPDPGSSNGPFRIYNIGNSVPVALTEYISAIEAALGRTAIRNLLPLQPGDVLDTYADVSRLRSDVGYQPGTPVLEGVRAFVAWYRSYYAC